MCQFGTPGVFRGVLLLHPLECSRSTVGVFCSTARSVILHSIWHLGVLHSTPEVLFCTVQGISECCHSTPEVLFCTVQGISECCHSTPEVLFCTVQGISECCHSTLEVLFCTVQGISECCHSTLEVLFCTVQGISECCHSTLKVLKECNCMLYIEECFVPKGNN